MKSRQLYVCSACGQASPRWQGQCPGCKAWNSLVAEAPPPPGRVRAAGPGRRTPPSVLAEASVDSLAARQSGLPEFDRFLGRGLIAGSAMLLAGEPGVGKSTLLLQLAGAVAASGGHTVYASGEESLPQLKDRAERLGVLSPRLLALATSSLEDILSALEHQPAPDLLIVDSVQTVASSDIDGIPGSVSQVRAVAGSLVEAVKKTSSTLILVGHVTKDGQIAGPKLLEHMVDTVLSLEGERRHLFRILRLQKNRFGPSDELLVMSMDESGLTIVPDPSTFFLGEREPGLPGTAVVMTVDGHRPLAVEVQALVTGSFLAMPRRTSLGFDANRLHLILAVMEKHLGTQLGQLDVYAKIGAGLKLQEPGLDLGLAAAVLSSLSGRALPPQAVFWGEIDLNGRIRPCAEDHLRLRQAERLGYAPILRAGPKLRTLGDLARALD